MSPVLGQTVIYNQPLCEDARERTRQHAAIVTRDWGTDMPRNLMVFFDDGKIEHIHNVSPSGHHSASDRERVGSFDLLDVAAAASEEGSS